MPIREFLTPLLATQGIDLSGSYRLLRRPKPPVLTNWLVTFLGRDRSYDITAARRDLGYTPEVSVADGLAEMTAPRGADRRG